MEYGLRLPIKHDATYCKQIIAIDTGSQEDGVEAADPFMIIVPPIEQFTNSYLVTTPGADPIPFTNFINIVVERAELEGLRVDHKPVS